MVDIKISNKTFFVIALLGILLIVTGFSYAAWTNKAVFHSADNIKVTISGDDYSLQEAVNDKLIITGQIETRTSDPASPKTGQIWLISP